MESIATSSGMRDVPHDTAAVRHSTWQRAQRHSRRVRRLRVVLPVLGLLLALGLFVSFQSIPSPIGDVELSSIGVEGDTVTMEAPKLTGYGEEGLNYAVSADRAQQNLSSPNVVRLQGIDGRLDEEGGRWTALRAAEGTLDTDAETLRLDNSIELTTNDGKRATLQSADIDFSRRTVSSEEPVELEMDVGRVAAGSIEVSEGGKRIVLRGNVKVDMRMNGSLENALGTPE
ncbi:hypothetical protein N177_1233 [Lutibaculum baratangense AMV1]|uniref:Lipopolysaccharide export system protein LptC n=1 Tax=Lutibaculum baratangense AMV1 TaxID=631454 RepID=V4TJ00_9HYPH|nr:hypothetical protein N177_1233 [Lutibaculum baratangense AMV1]